jgi:hypothetical protein
MSERLDQEQRDPTEQFHMQLAIAKMQASEQRFFDAYQSLVMAYDNLLEQHEEVIEELLELRKKLSLK